MTRTLFCLFAILGGFMAIQWHDDFTERKLAAIERAERQQRIKAIRALSCGESPFYLVQAPVVLMDSTPTSGR